MFPVVSFRVVVKPLTAIVTPFAVWLLIWIEISVGGAGATVIFSVVGLAGVRSTLPARVANVGVNVIVLATVPVCNPIWVP